MLLFTSIESYTSFSVKKNIITQPETLHVVDQLSLSVLI